MNAPFEIMIVKLFVPVVQWFWSEEKGGFCERPIEPEQFVDAIEAKMFFGLFQINLDVIIGIHSGFNSAELTEGGGGSSWFVSI